MTVLDAQEALLATWNRWVQFAGSRERWVDGRNAGLGRNSVCASPCEDGPAAEFDALLRRSVEHALAHAWLATRAEQLNDRQAACVAELLDERTSVIRMKQLHRQLGQLRYAFVNELELTWSFDVDRPRGTDALQALIDRAARLTHRWQRELTRFERLESVASAVSALDLTDTPAPIQLPEVIPGLKEDRNPFRQVSMWWRYRGELRNVPGRGVSVLRRTGPRQRDKPPPGAREIELHPFRDRYALFEELNASIALASFMTAASAVFLGVILQKGQHSVIPMDVLFLFIATFGFLFATLIYANASGLLARYGTFGYESQVEIANRVSEYLGVFPLLVAIPLSVSRFLKTGPIPWTVAALALTATVAYHYLHGASLLERDVANLRIGSDRQRKFVVIPALAVLMAATYLGELTHHDALEIAGAAGFGTISLLLVLFSAMLPEHTNPQGYLVDEWDALSPETPSFFAGRDTLPADERGGDFF